MEQGGREEKGGGRRCVHWEERKTAELQESEGLPFYVTNVENSGEFIMYLLALI